MIIGTVLLRLYVPTSQSLKDKRQVVKSIQARLQNQFGVAVAEVGDSDRRQVAELGVACVSNGVRHADQILDAVIAFVEETRPDLEITITGRETASYFG